MEETWSHAAMEQGEQQGLWARFTRSAAATAAPAHPKLRVSRGGERRQNLKYCLLRKPAYCQLA